MDLKSFYLYMHEIYYQYLFLYFCCMIDQTTIQKIFDTADIYEVVSDFVSLKKRGVNYVGCCPFHNEKTGSFTVSPAKGIYKCFGCGKGGNAVNFIMEHEQLSYVEALRWLAAKYNIIIEEKELSEQERQEKSERESMLIVTNYAEEFLWTNCGIQMKGNRLVWGISVSGDWMMKPSGNLDWDIVPKCGIVLRSLLYKKDISKTSGKDRADHRIGPGTV